MLSLSSPSGASDVGPVVWEQPDNLAAVSSRSKLKAGPGAFVLMLRAARLLAISNHALRDGRPAEEVLRTMAPTHRRGALTSPASAAAAVRRAGRLVPSATCVPQAITMAALLTPTGAPIAVVLGAKRNPLGGHWTAHAWVEVAGASWPHPGDTAFRRLATYTAESNWSLLPIDDPLLS